MKIDYFVKQGQENKSHLKNKSKKKMKEELDKRLSDIVCTVW